MVANDKLRNMEEVTNDNRNTASTDDNSPAEGTTPQDKSHPKTSTPKDCNILNKENAKQSCFYKPLSSPMLRQRKQPISMFEVQRSAATEIIEVQEICIETGSQQYVKESVTVLPELSSNLPISDQDELLTEIHTVRSALTLSNNLSEVSESWQDLRKVVVGKDNGWMGSKLDVLRIPSCPTTPPVSPNTRRRSLGVLRTPAWGLRTYRDPDKIEHKSCLSLRRRSLVSPVRYVQGKQSPCSLRRKSPVSPDVTELTTGKDSMNCNQPSNSTEELSKPREEQRLHFGNENNSQEECQTNINNQVKEKQTNCSSDDEFEDFRPRLRSRSLDDSRTQARENVLQNVKKRSHHESQKRKENRRKSFEVWLTDKEQETIGKLHMLALGKQRAAEDEAKRKEQRKGKTYEEWLHDKNNMAAVKDVCSEGKQEDTTKQEKQQIAKRRYDKWLMEKETQGLEKERDMLKESKLKTIEMRRKYEEKKKSKLKFLTSSLFS